MNAPKMTRESVEALRDVLRAKDPVNDGLVSNQAAVATLESEIRAMQQRGFTLDQVAQELRAHGLEISLATLKNYLHRISKARKEATPQLVVTAKTAVARKPLVQVRKAQRDVRSPSPSVAEDLAPAVATFVPAEDTNDI